MRIALLCFGAVGGVGVAGLIGAHGFDSSATTAAGVGVAFLFGFIAAGAIGGPMAVAYLVRHLSGWRKLWGVPASLVVAVSVVGHGINSLDALVTRMDRSQAERIHNSATVGNDKAELERLMVERDRIPAFSPASADSLKAAEAAVAAAARMAGVECDKRGPLCRQREGEERDRRTELAAIASNRAQTERAALLDAAAAAARRRLAAAPPDVAANPWAEAVGRLLHVPPADASTIRWFYIATAAELLIAFALLGGELLYTTQPPATPVAQPKPPVRAPPVRPSRAQVGRFMLQCLPRAAGAAAGGRETFGRYERWCAEQSPPEAAFDAKTFGAELGAICKRVGIKTERRDGRVFLVNVRLAA